MRDELLFLKNPEINLVEALKRKVACTYFPFFELRTKQSKPMKIQTKLGRDRVMIFCLSTMHN